MTGPSRRSPDPARTLPSRRTFLASVGTAAAVGLAGCTQDGGGGEPAMSATVVAGPDGSLTFEPERVSLKVGGTVTWEFDSANHNVSAKPEDANPVELPEAAEPFASYGDGNPYSNTVEKGGTYEHAFEVPGEYTYVCVPHVASEMIGHVTVGE